MKKLLSMTMLLTVMFLTFSACSNDDDDVATTYTLENIAQMVPPYRSVGTARSGSVVPLISV